MEIVVTGRHVQGSERFRRHLDEKLAKVPQLAPRVQRLDVVVTHEVNKRQSKGSERVEITCHVKGPVVRAEASADDEYGALDIAMDKLLERLRRDHDRRRVHRGRRVPESVAQATARLAAAGVGLNGQSAAGAPAVSAGDKYCPLFRILWTVSWADRTANSPGVPVHTAHTTKAAAITSLQY